MHAKIVYYVSPQKSRDFLKFHPPGQPYNRIGEKNVLAYFFTHTIVCDERPLMSKTVAPATLSTQCGFANGAL